MVYFKAFLVGCLAALLAVILSVVLSLFPMIVQLMSAARTGSGGIGAVVAIGPSTLLAAPIGFLLGVWWYLRYRRHSRLVLPK